MTDLMTTRQMPARANWGRWLAECATSWCLNAELVEPGQADWLCRLCGVVTEVVWPADPAAIEVILLMRPDPNTRNWEPGEGLADLIAQNAEHGILLADLPIGLAPGEAVDVLVERGGRVIGGLLYGPVQQRRELLTAAASITTTDEPRAYAALPKE